MSDIFDDVMSVVEDESELVNHVVMILDKSGSMARFGDEPRQNFNQQLRTLREEKGDQKTLLTYIEFGSTVDMPIYNRDIDIIDELDLYQASQPSTRLNDAIARGITAIRENVEKKNHTALVIIITDGHENDSKEFGGPEGTEQVRKMIKDMEKTGDWTFTFMGTDNINVESMTGTLGFAAGNIAKYDADVGMSRTADFGETQTRSFSVADKMSGGISEYYNARRQGQTSVKNLYSDGGNDNAE